MLLAVDPGLDTGISYWSGGRLVMCNLGGTLVLDQVRKAIIEYPQVYPYTRAKEANDLITLAIQVGQYKERIERDNIPVRLVHPHTWKGSLKKEIHHPRIERELLPEELRILHIGFKGVCKSKQHNIWDSIGLGLFELKRLTPNMGA